MKIKKVLTVFFLFSLILSSCDEKNAVLVNRTNVDHANPVDATDICLICNENVSKDCSTCKVCKRRFCTKCVKGMREIMDDKICTACNAESSILMVGEDCPICYHNISENFSACRVCRRQFCTACVERWYKTSPRKSCPVCREEGCIGVVV